MGPLTPARDRARSPAPLPTLLVRSPLNRAAFVPARADRVRNMPDSQTFEVDGQLRLTSRLDITN